MSGSLQVSIEGRTARVTLDRPQTHNAFDDGLIGELSAELDKLARDASLRALVLSGAGASFIVVIDHTDSRTNPTSAYNASPQSDPSIKFLPKRDSLSGTGSG